MEVFELTVRHFRNLSGPEFRFSQGTNVVLGANGAGKTNLLEALVVLGNLRSFRASSLRPAVRHGETSFHLSGVVSSSGRTRHLTHIVEIGPPMVRTVMIDGRVANVKRYLQSLPLFAITAQDRELVEGGPDVRRALLDRFVFLLHPTYIEELRAYRRLLRQRNAALLGGATDAEMRAWEMPLAAAAAAVVTARSEGARVLAERFADVRHELTAKDSVEVTLEYRTESWIDAKTGAEEVEDLYRQRYNETRTRDRQMGFTVDGPHRHDVSLKTDGRSVRHVLSSGQTKGVAAALKLATLTQVERERNERFPVLVDDVDAELDRAALKLLVERLGSDRQLFLSSTDESVADLTGLEGCRIELEHGARVTREAGNDD